MHRDVRDKLARQDTKRRSHHVFPLRWVFAWPPRGGEQRPVPTGRINISRVGAFVAQGRVPACQRWSPRAMGVGHKAQAG